MIEYFFGFCFILLGLYAILIRQNLVKKIIGAHILTGGIHILLATIGFYGSLETPIPPIAKLGLPLVSVDPVPQALILTSIVINVSVTALLLLFTLYIHKKTGTIKI
jgi:multicomponent Na+:H+ antiporter subunit C